MSITRVTLDDVLRTKLLNLTQPLEFCDESGKVVGSFQPAVELAGYERCEPEISEEELRSREQSNEWYSTKEVLARLEQC
jgi:hypothetical protein